MESKLAQPRNVIGTSDISGSFVSAQVICLSAICTIVPLCKWQHNWLAQLHQNYATEAEAALCYLSLHPCIAYWTLSSCQGLLALQQHKGFHLTVQCSALFHVSNDIKDQICLQAAFRE